MRNLIYYIPAVTALMMALHSCKKTPVIYPQRKDIIETVYASGRIILSMNTDYHHSAMG
jgi:hypothetical protein